MQFKRNPVEPRVASKNKGYFIFTLIFVEKIFFIFILEWEFQITIRHRIHHFNGQLLRVV